ncbi:hypothetical protein BH10PSE18_BH10PSE18_06620 [soil metagenome]
MRMVIAAPIPIISEALQPAPRQWARRSRRKSNNEGDIP